MTKTSGLALQNYLTGMLPFQNQEWLCMCTSFFGLSISIWFVPYLLQSPFWSYICRSGVSFNFNHSSTMSSMSWNCVLLGALFHRCKTTFWQRCWALSRSLIIKAWWKPHFGSGERLHVLSIWKDINQNVLKCWSCLSIAWWKRERCQSLASSLNVQVAFCRY